MSVLLTGAIGLITLVYVYLQSAESNGKSISLLEHNKLMRNALEDFAKQQAQAIKNISESNMTEEFINRLVNNETVLNKIRDQIFPDPEFIDFDDDDLDRSIQEEVHDYIDGVRNRINRQLFRLSRNANINLAIGGVTTALGIIFLGVDTFTSHLNFNEPYSIITHYIPRISIVIFIEVFSFFFLKMYKTNHRDIKYFLNESTNIDMKIISLRCAIENKDDESTKAALANLLLTERNFILKKGETTAEIQKEKVETRMVRDLMKIIPSIGNTK
jgi:multisubunit Na+/H+ antiporter MnhE subunit